MKTVVCNGPKRGVCSHDLELRSLSRKATRGILICGGMRLSCMLGRGGRQVRKREGDGATPVGTWAVRHVAYRSDRVARPTMRYPIRPIGVHDGWCDAPADRNYNRSVRHPYPASAERMWRDDGLYDIVVILGYNDHPRRRGCGSAIFMHLARPDRKPTEGCIALSQRDLRLVLQWMRRGARVRVVA
jgi:L,D-peptidoglycan transpeptidase YkuD (ErfK/YbiS/YcfS/YnhG family)